MRRKDREMPAEFGLELMGKAPFGVLSIADPEQPDLPYSLPLSLALLDGRLYFHSAKAGRKTELLKDGTKGRICFVTDVKVPDLMSEEELARRAEAGQIGSILSKVFTTEYASAIVTGTLRQVKAEAEYPLFYRAMEAICLKYTPDKMAYFDRALAFSLERTAVYEFTIETIQAKRKSFGAEAAKAAD